MSPPATTLPGVEHRPYRGQRPYEAADADLYFGRDADLERLLSRIRGSWLTLLHARSGAGKTSLVNTRVLPRLEQDGMHPVRVRLGEVPIESTRAALIEQLLAPPSAEEIAVRRALGLLELPPSTPLAELVRRWDELPVADPRRRQAVTEVQCPVDRAAPPLLPFTFSPVVPAFARFLRGSLPIEGLHGLYAAALLDPDADPSAAAAVPLHADSRADALLSWLAAPARVAAHARVVAACYDPAPGLEPVVDALCAALRRWRPSASLVVVFDQFEELYSRFVDRGAQRAADRAASPDWRHRPAFLAELRSLHEAASRSRRPLPLHLVLSMRDDWIGRLDEVRAFARDLDRSTYHLPLLDLDDARAAIERPAAAFGYAYTDACYAAMLDELALEGRFVEPAHLQVVCNKLWEVSGEALARSGAGAVDLAAFRALGGVAGILDGVFQELLATLAEDERAEVLLILDPLITAAGNRNIAPWDDLRDAPHRPPVLRGRMLDLLVDRHVLRMELRLGQSFAEITHEFLIAPIRRALLDARAAPDSAFHDLEAGLGTLRQIEARGAWHLPLARPDYLALERSFHLLPLDLRLASLLLRSALTWGGAGERAPVVWAQVLAGLDEGSAGPLPLDLLLARLDPAQPGAPAPDPTLLEVALATSPPGDEDRIEALVGWLLASSSGADEPEPPDGEVHP